MREIEEIIKGLQGRAEVRRRIRKEDDKIAAQLEEAVECIICLQAAAVIWKQRYEDCMNEKSQQEKMYGKQQQG